MCSSTEYKAVFERVMRLPPQVDHLVVQIGAGCFILIAICEASTADAEGRTRNPNRLSSDGVPRDCARIKAQPACRARQGRVDGPVRLCEQV